MILSVISIPIGYSSCFYKTTDITNFYYSDNIVPGTTLVWEVIKFLKSETSENWTVTTGKTLEQGDKFKIEITQDPDELSIANYIELFDTSEAWANFYINNDSLGSDASLLNLNYNLVPNDYVNYSFLLPTTLHVGASNVSTFHHLYDIAQPYEFNNKTMVYELTLQSDLLIIRYESHLSGIGFFIGRYSVDYVFEASYNLQWGYLNKLELYKLSKTEFFGDEKTHLILANELSTQKLDIKWLPIMIPFFILGSVVIYKRSRRK